jgi:hypothetical protein
MDLANPVVRSHYRNGFIKQYVRDHLMLRTEASTNNVTDYGRRQSGRQPAGAAHDALGHQR